MLIADKNTEKREHDKQRAENKLLPVLLSLISNSVRRQEMVWEDQPNIENTINDAYQ